MERGEFGKNERFNAGASVSLVRQPSGRCRTKGAGKQIWGMNLNGLLGFVAGGIRKVISTHQILRRAQDFGARLGRRASASTC
jgi:hypothetical protein